MRFLWWLRTRWLTLVGPVLILGLWELVVRTGALSAVLYPPPTAIVERSLDLFGGDSALGRDVLVTVRRLLLTAGMAAVAGIAIGLVVASARWIGKGLEGVLSFLYPIPSILFLPIIAFQFGRTETTLLITAAVTPFIIMTVATSFGVRQLDERLIEASRNYGAHGGRFFLRVLLPGSMSSVVTGFRVALGFSLITVVALEMVMAREGLGALLWTSWRIMRVRDTYVALLAVAILGLLVTRGFSALADRMMPWRAEHLGTR
jgi:ABC-type nitrate/sulfonate/bicarbonate transport system permease component